MEVYGVGMPKSVVQIKLQVTSRLMKMGVSYSITTYRTWLYTVL